MTNKIAVWPNYVTAVLSIVSGFGSLLEPINYKIFGFCVALFMINALFFLIIERHNKTADKLKNYK